MDIKLLDCTLRDGGYRNNWGFSREQTKNTIQLLNDSKIEYIECGYLTGGSENEAFSTRFGSIGNFNNLVNEIGGPLRAKLFLMIDIKDFPKINLPVNCSNNPCVYGFRLAFHKNNFTGISHVIDNIINNGYKVF